MRITLAQIPVREDISQNLEVLRQALKAARVDESDVLLTPEGVSSAFMLKTCCAGRRVSRPAVRPQRLLQSPPRFSGWTVCPWVG